MEDNLADPNDTTYPAFLKMLSVLSMCFSIILITLIFCMLVVFLLCGPHDYEIDSFLLKPPIWQLHLSILIPLLYGVFLFAGGKWCMEVKKQGWYIISSCFFVTILLLGKLTYNIIVSNPAPHCFLPAIALWLFFWVGYVYLFTDKPRFFLNVQGTNRLLIIFLQLLFCFTFYIILPKIFCWLKTSAP